MTSMSTAATTHSGLSALSRRRSTTVTAAVAKATPPNSTTPTRDSPGSVMEPGTYITGMPPAVLTGSAVGMPYVRHDHDTQCHHPDDSQPVGQQRHAGHGSHNFYRFTLISDNRAAGQQGLEMLDRGVPLASDFRHTGGPRFPANQCTTTCPA